MRHLPPGPQLWDTRVLGAAGNPREHRVDVRLGEQQVDGAAEPRMWASWWSSAASPWASSSGPGGTPRARRLLRIGEFASQLSCCFLDDPRAQTKNHPEEGPHMNLMVSPCRGDHEW